MKKIFGILFFVSLLWACSSDNEGASGNDDDPTQVNFERAPMLVNWSDNIIIPSYEAFSVDITSLTASFDAFKADANVANLTALRASWLTAYKSWQKVSMFEIGPAETVGLRLNMNIYPTDVTTISEHIASGSYDLSLSSNRDAKGFPALDYLINGLEVSDDAIVEKYNATDSASLITYVEAVLLDMTTLSSGVLSDWKTSFRDTFVANDGSSATASVDRYLNDYAFYYEKFLRAGKLGIPLGVFSGTQASTTTEAFYQSEVSNDLFQEALTATQDFFNGKHFGSSTVGESMASYLETLDRKDLSDDINAQFNLARVAVNGLAPFREELETNDPAIAMFAAYDEVQKAVSMMKVDMFSAMSISVDFIDADGD